MLEEGKQKAMVGQTALPGGARDEAQPESDRPATVRLDNGAEVALTQAMSDKLRILNMYGFESNNPRVIATLLNQYPRNPNDKFRTKCFLREEDRVRAHLNVVKRSKSS